MAQEKRVNGIPVGVIAAISAAVVVAGGAAAWWKWNSANSPTLPTNPNIVQPLPPPPPPVQSAPEQRAQIYWLNDTGNHLKLVPKSVTVAAAAQPKAVLEAAFQELLAGPTDAALGSTIPQGTKLRSVNIQNDGIHVDLSQEFTKGGGSASMTSRLAQVLYTATTLQPDAKVWINVEGKPLEVLGGEGLELDQPLTRKSFEGNFTL